jgi:sigma-B regulation protein RsbU (phosphoserine phosphatase)
VRILVSDDQPDVLEAIRLLLKTAGHDTQTADSPRALLAAASQTFDLILMDMNYTRDTTSGEEGLHLLRQLLQRDKETSVVVMTAWSSVDLAVEAMRSGAADFIQKPWENARLLAVIEMQASRSNERRRSRTDLEIARHVQQRLLPKYSRLLQTAEYGGRCFPAGEVGGDYYDFLDLGPGRAGLLLADVSGKGVGSALLTANLQACFRSQLDLGVRDPKALLASANRLFYESTLPEIYATIFFAEYYDAARELRYISCGHPNGVLVRNSGAVESLGATSLPVGAFARWECEEKSTLLERGDLLVIVSDGVLEAGLDQGDEFGETRLIEAIRSAPPEGIESLLDHLAEAVAHFSPGPQADDVTLVALRA